MADARRRVVLSCLVGLGAALLLVGVVSGTVFRHLVQVVPIAVAAGVLARRPEWGAYASLPLVLFWLCMVGLIWLFLVGLSRVADGHYTPIEVVCTFLMAGFAGVGVASGISLGKPLRPLGRLLAFALFAAMQVAAMWVSFLKPIADR